MAFELDNNLLNKIATPDAGKSQWQRLHEATPGLVDTLQKSSTLKEAQAKRRADALASAATTELAIQKANQSSTEFRLRMSDRAETKLSNAAYKELVVLADSGNASDKMIQELATEALVQNHQVLTVEDYDKIRQIGKDAGAKWDDPEVRHNNWLSVTAALRIGDAEGAMRDAERAGNFPNGSVSSIEEVDDGRGGTTLNITGVNKAGGQIPFPPVNLSEFELDTPDGKTRAFERQNISIRDANSTRAADVANTRKINAADRNHNWTLQAVAQGKTFLDPIKDLGQIQVGVVAINQFDEDFLDEVTSTSDQEKPLVAMLMHDAEYARLNPNSASYNKTMKEALVNAAAAYKVGFVTGDYAWYETLFGSPPLAQDSATRKISDNVQNILDQYKNKEESD